MHHQQVQDRNFEVKLLALQRGKQEYDSSYQQLLEETDRYDRMAQDWQSRLKQEQELTTQQNVAKVVSQLEQVSPDVGKEQLMRWIDEKKMDDAILLMSKMSESKLAKILKTFETETELEAAARDPRADHQQRQRKLKVGKGIGRAQRRGRQEVNLRSREPARNSYESNQHRHAVSSDCDRRRTAS